MKEDSGFSFHYCNDCRTADAAFRTVHDESGCSKAGCTQLVTDQGLLDAARAAKISLQKGLKSAKTKHKQAAAKQDHIPGMKWTPAEVKTFAESPACEKTIGDTHFGHCEWCRSEKPTFFVTNTGDCGCWGKCKGKSAGITAAQVTEKRNEYKLHGLRGLNLRAEKEGFVYDDDERIKALVLKLHTKEGRNHSDLGRLWEAKYGDNFRYDHSRGKWFQCDDYGLWRLDSKFQSLALCRKIGEVIGAKTLKEKGMMRGALALASTNEMLAMAGNEWDRESLFVGSPKGVLCLESGQILSRHAGRAKMITKAVSCVPADPAEVQGSLWVRCVKEWAVGNEELEVYLKRLAGYCLMGNPVEQIFHFLDGVGGNGKSLFLETLYSVFAEYGIVTPIEVFLQQEFAMHPTDIAAMQGMRLVISSEPPKGRKLNESLLKILVGGDTISARHMRQDSFQYKPQMNILFSGNGVPGVSSTGKALRRRMRVVPFLFEPTSVDEQLQEKLLQEKPIVLRWILDGIQEYMEKGLNRPDLILKKTEDYFQEQEQDLLDPVQVFIDERCITGAELAALQEASPMMETSTKLDSLYAAFEAWHSQEYSRKSGLSKRQMGIRLTKCGIGRLKVGGQVHRTGIILCP